MAEDFVPVPVLEQALTLMARTSSAVSNAGLEFDIAASPDGDFEIRWQHASEGKKWIVCCIVAPTFIGIINFTVVPTTSVVLDPLDSETFNNELFQRISTILHPYYSQK